MDNTLTRQSRFEVTLADHDLTLPRTKLTTLQINLGKLCNQACLHCHVDAGPNKKRENMDYETAERLVALAAETPSLHTVDLTGGAPELNPHFRYLVNSFRDLGLNILDRCNLTVLHEEGQESTAEFLAKNKVDIVASLPCYSMENVDAQRGDGVFEKSISSLRRLNDLGYGKDGSGLEINLVYNPLGAFLPPDQHKLEKDYKEMLLNEFNIRFNNLFCITNMPIKRFLVDLKRQGKVAEYMTLLKDNFNIDAAKGVMCRNIVSISWDGKMFDCDFNQMLNIPIESKDIWNINSLEEINDTKIKFADHCYGCTAGAGSSCGGTLTE